MMKISLSDIKNLVITGSLTLAIIAGGVAIPALLLSSRADRKSLPQGEVNINDIHPYGADEIENYRRLMRCIDGYWQYPVADSDIVVNNVPDRTAYRVDQYREIGITSENPVLLGSPECINELNNIISANFGGATLPDSYDVYAVTNDFWLLNGPDEDDEDENYRNVIILDPDTGVPLVANIRLYSEDYTDLTTVFFAIASLYQEYAGIALVNDTDDESLYCPGGSFDYDINYFNSIMSSDERFILYVYIDSGWYWTPPTYQGDGWHQTTMHQWDIYFTLEYLGT